MALILAFNAIFFCLPAVADFVVDDIRVEGAQNIEVGTIFNYLPVKVGDVADEGLIDSPSKHSLQPGFSRTSKFVDGKIP